MGIIIDRITIIDPTIMADTDIGLTTDPIIALTIALTIAPITDRTTTIIIVGIIIGR